LAIATVDPRESRGSNRGRQAATEDRKPEEGQPRNTQNTRKSGKHRRRATTEHTEHTEVRKARKKGNRVKGGVIGGKRWFAEEPVRKRPGRGWQGEKGLSG
jgi:hypothetical protein